MALWKRISIALVSLLICVSLFVGTASYGTVKKLILQNKEDDIENVLNLIDMSVTEQLLQFNAIVDSFSESQSVKEILCIGEKQSQDKNKAYLRDLSASFTSVSGIYLLNQENGLVFCSEKSTLPGEEDFTLSLEEAKKSPEKTMYFVGKEGESIFLIRSIREKEQVLGTVILEFSPDIFTKLLINNLSTFRHQYTFILDKEGKVVCSNNSVKTDYLETVQKRYAAGERRFSFTWDKKQYFACGQLNGVSGWRILSVIAMDDIFPQIRVLQEKIYLFVILALIMGVIVSLVLAWSVTKPLQQLSEEMGRVESGNLDSRIESKRKDEVGILIDSYNYMIGEIKRLVNEVYEEKMAQKTAEIKALQAQINPHFLYNTLDTINWMLLDRGEDDISDIIVNLGDLLKYSISGSSTEVPLKEEIKYIQSYLEIQKCRMEDRLEYGISIAENCMECRCPKLLLQPIVENAIKHGIEPLARGGKIEIEAFLGREGLNILLKDNGKGMEEEEIEKIQSGKANIGLNNVMKRIKLLYGPEYGIRILSKVSEGTEVDLRIPALFEGLDL